jgi:Abnormal spindle-like microcephaly-assoc'd, ASPM-SPD-2-Hydin
MTGRYGWCLLLVGACLACVGFVTTAGAQCPLSFDPASINFGNQSVEVASAEVSITVTDTLQKNVGVSGFSVTSPFQILSGHAPYVFTAGARTGWSIVFAPKAVGPFSGQLTLNLSGGYPPCVVPLTGTGISTGAVSSVSPTIINFGNVTEGSITPPQAITVTNTGTSELTVESATSSSDFFTVQGFTTPVVLNPGQSLGLTATFSAVGAQGYTGTLDLTYDVLPSNGVSFSGTGTAASTLTIDSLQILPDAIQGSNYSAQLEAAGGTPPYTWKLNSGSSLPAGLALAGGGTITGTVASSVLPGNYSFSVAMHDSSPQGASATAQFTIPVSVTTGANCNRIQADIVGTGNALVAITDLGTGSYLGVEGGLYPNGSNVRPAGQDAAGVALAQQIGPLDANGNPDPNGLYGLVTIGISITKDESDTFVSIVGADPSRNPQLVVVNGAQPSASVADWANPTSSFWTTLLNYLLPNVGLTANQIVAVWEEDIDAFPTGTFPGDISQTEANLISVAQNVLTLFPNVKVMYLSSSPYTGYAGGNEKQEPEPYAYESAFAAQQVIADQISGDPSLNYNPALGPVVAPWLSWGPYYWTNGLTGREDGFVWPCQDSQADGTHPSTPYGTDEVADQLLHFFKTDDSASPWFLALSGAVAVLSPSSLTFAAQNVGTTSPAQMITLSNTGTAALNITNIGITGTDPGDFSQTNTCPASVAVGTSCTFSVTFTPQASGTRTSLVSITDNAPGSPQSVSLTGTAIGGVPQVTLSATSLTFATQVVGTMSGAQIVTVANTGTGTLKISSLSITGAQSTDFAQTNTCGTGLAPGANCAVSVTFRPTNRNNRVATLSITDNASGSPQTVTLTGVGTDITLTPASLTFGSQAVGTTSPAQTVTLSNILAQQAISITSISLSGANPGDFTETNTCGGSVGAQASCTISVTFTPTATGTRTASVMIADNGGGSPQLVRLTGTGGVPQVTLSPTSLTFPTQVVGTTSAAQIVTVANTGTGTLNFSSIGITGAGSASFAQTKTCGASLAAGSSCTVSVIFKPANKNSQTANLSITDNASGSPQAVSLTGVGTDVMLTPASLTFGNQAVGTTSPSQTVKLTNILAQATITIGSITITGVDPSDFAETNTCGGSVGPGASCVITVTFTPIAMGTRTALLGITDNAGGSPQSVGLTGTGKGQGGSGGHAQL